MCQNVNLNLKYLKFENTALFAFLYQNGRHRGEKFIQIIKKLVKCMKNWDEINLHLLIVKHLHMFPSEITSIKQIRLPTTNSMHFLLSRSLGSYRLMMKTSSYCLQAAYYLRAKLVTGHFFANATVAFAFVSRIRALSLDMAFTIAQSYDEVYPFLSCIFKICTEEEYPLLPCNLKEDFQKELSIRKTCKYCSYSFSVWADIHMFNGFVRFLPRSDGQKNHDGDDCDIECHNLVNLGVTVGKENTSETVCANNKKKANLNSNNSTSNLKADKMPPHYHTLSGSTTLNENEDLGIYVDEKDFALIKKVMSKDANRSNKQMKNLCKKRKNVNKNVTKNKIKKTRKLIK